MTTKIILTRKDDTVSCDGASGKRSNIKVGGMGWHSIERMNGYKWLRPGDYVAEFGIWTSTNGNKSKAIRVLDIYDNRVYIHPANYPKQLAGCIAPGKSEIDCGVGDSASALKEIFAALGGYVEGKKLELEVIGNVYDESASKEPGDISNVAYQEPDKDLLIG